MSGDDTRHIAEQLHASPLFKGVELADREALVHVMRRESYADGDVLFHKGAPGDSMYIILSGRIRIFTTDADGRAFTIRHLDQMFGEFSMLDGQSRSASAAAAGALDVLVLHRDDFTAFLQQRPLVGLSMMQNLVERVRYTTTYLQKVMDAMHNIAEGNYEQAIQDTAAGEGETFSGTDAEIQALVETFVQMMRNVQAREEELKQAIDTQHTDST
ncbi:MAG: cyclic nucleotide-binding domain-containing protein [Anaerolineae bacterium]|nr:cyclic nucleotide-binding domain-containing protein [Anaerolineae bacterium]